MSEITGGDKLESRRRFIKGCATTGMTVFGAPVAPVPLEKIMAEMVTPGVSTVVSAAIPHKNRLKNILVSFARARLRLDIEMKYERINKTPIWNYSNIWSCIVRNSSTLAEAVSCLDPEFNLANIKPVKMATDHFFSSTPFVNHFSLDKTDLEYLVIDIYSELLADDATVRNIRAMDIKEAEHQVSRYSEYVYVNENDDFLDILLGRAGRDYDNNWYNSDQTLDFLEKVATPKYEDSEDLWNTMDGRVYNLYSALMDAPPKSVKIPEIEEFLTGFNEKESRPELSNFYNKLLHNLEKAARSKPEFLRRVKGGMEIACDAETAILKHEIERMGDSREYIERKQKEIEHIQKEFAKKIKAIDVRHERRYDETRPPMHGYTIADPRYIHPQKEYEQQPHIENC